MLLYREKQIFELNHALLTVLINFLSIFYDIFVPSKALFVGCGLCVMVHHAC
jgi:hypothetical protein